jgi:MSHA biogenesis protein MshK
MKQLLLLLYFGLANTQASTMKDPTQPSPNKPMFNAGEMMAPMALKLTAIINGSSFAEGQNIQGYKLIFISQNHVLLHGSDGKQTLFINNNNIKKDVTNGF